MRIIGLDLIANGPGADGRTVPAQERFAQVVANAVRFEPFRNRNASTRSRVGGTTGSPSDQSRSTKWSCTWSNPPANTTSRGPGSPSAASAVAAAEEVSASTTAGATRSRILVRNVAVSSVRITPG